MSNGRKSPDATSIVMLLIDADNVSLDLIEQALERLRSEHGEVHVRRAYCTAESAVKNQAAFKRLGIRPMVNLAAGKNSTDIAMAVDAIDLVVSERPRVVVIASSDSDFAPLVSRLREKGCRVCGIGQAGKTGAETQQVYDEFLVLTHRGHAPARADEAKGAPGRASAAGTRSASRSRSRAAKAAPAMPDAVRAVLAALPELRQGQLVELRVAAERLRAADLLGARASSTKYFAPLAEHFELLPAEQPNKLRWRGA